MTTQTQLAKADSLLGRCSQARVWLVQRAAGYSYLSLFSESIRCMVPDQAFPKQLATELFSASIKLHPLQKCVR